MMKLNNALLDCDECNGEGIVDYVSTWPSGDDVETHPCQKCFPGLTWNEVEN